MGAIGFFAPLPIALMIPFMGAQSAVMGEAFGKHFQYGKRKISAMSNEEFNKLTSADLFDDTLHGFKEMIPKLEQSMRRTEGLQSFVIEQLIRYVRSIPDDIIAGLTSGPVSESPLIQNLEGNISGGIDIANQIASFFQKLNPLPPAAGAVSPPGAINNPPDLQKEILKILTKNKSKFIGPKLPPGHIPSAPAPDNTIGGKDTRIPAGKGGTLRAPSSVITTFNKLNAAIRSWHTIIQRQPERKASALLTIASLNKQMLSLWKKYDLTGKVSTSNYTGTPLR